MTALRVERLIHGCLDTLRVLGKTVRVELIAHARGSTVSPRKRTLQLLLGASATPLTFDVRTTGSQLSGTLASRIIEEARHANGSRLLFAPYVPMLAGQRLAAERVSYVDLAGNCHIETEGALIAHVEGKRPIRESAPPSSGIKAHQLLFALLAQPQLVDTPVRKIAREAGIGKSAAFELVAALRAQRLLDCGPDERRLHSGRVLLERWLTAYADVVRPSWLVARCEPVVTDPHALEALIERECRSFAWALGGSAAASRMIRADREAETVVHFAEVPLDLMQRLQAVPSATGALSILRTPGATAYRGTAPHLVHPLLVYTELLSSTELQSRRVAALLRERFLRYLDPL